MERMKGVVHRDLREYGILPEVAWSAIFTSTQSGQGLSPMLKS
jgi:hypothetical protein